MVIDFRLQMHDKQLESGQAYDRGSVNQTLTAQVITVAKTVHRSNHYSALEGIAPEEWDEIFDRVGCDWEPEEDEYLLQWYGKDDIIRLSYALGRTPWTVTRRYKRLTESQPEPVKQEIRIVYAREKRQIDFLKELFAEGDEP